MVLKIKYHYHSGFSVETQNHFLVFDYWSDNSNDPRGLLDKKLLKSHKKVIVFVSHRHHDHYDKVIFDWLKENENISYVLSSEILTEKTKNIHFMKPYETLRLCDCLIKTYGSTDEGVSFLVRTDGADIFHAGDLNDWYWYLESTPDELKEDEQNFFNEIEKIKGENIDVAFFPVDPRLKEFYYKGGEYFARILKPKFLVPMHFEEQYRVTEQFSEKIKDIACETVKITCKGQDIIYTKKE